jgi:hypothetical protein
MSTRTQYATIDGALASFTWWPTANFEVVRETVATLDVSEIYVPAGRGYIGIVVSDPGPIVSVHSGYIWNLRNTDGGLFGLALPVNRLRDGNNENHRGLDGGECPECGLMMPLAGVCDCW